MHGETVKYLPISKISARLSSYMV